MHARHSVPPFLGIDLARAKWLQNPKPNCKITKDALGAVLRCKLGFIDVFLESTPALKNYRLRRKLVKSKFVWRPL